MAIITCRKCNAKADSKLKICPSCNSKLLPKTSKITWGILGFFVLFIIFAVVLSDGGSSTQSNTTNTQPQKNELPKGIQYEGKTTDPTARGMIILVKEKLTKDAINPESVQFQNVFYANQNNMTAICGEINIVKSAGQSGFKRFISNGMDFTAMESHSKNFDKLWNQVCKH